MLHAITFNAPSDYEPAMRHILWSISCQRKRLKAMKNTTPTPALENLSPPIPLLSIHRCIPTIYKLSKSKAEQNEWEVVSRCRGWEGEVVGREVGIKVA